MNVASLEQRLARIAGRVELARPRFDVEELPLVAPNSIEQAAELLKFASRDQLRVVPLGLGSKLGWCATPGHVDFLLSTRELTRVVSHVPDDGTITVEAGTTMAALKERCRGGGHFLTPDVARPSAKTIGGVVAANESGFDRLRFGPTRHHVLGTKVVLADGTLARSGGQLVKNVTGFDLQRLYCGSHGSLALIVEVSLRLFPEPESEVLAIAGAASSDEALELARRTLALPTRVVSLSIAKIDPPTAHALWIVVARLFGLAAAVRAEREQLAALWPKNANVGDKDARTEFESMRDRMSFADSRDPQLRVTCRPSKLAVTLHALESVLDAAKVAHRVALQPGVAEILVELRGASASQLAECATRARTELARHQASLELRNAPREALVALDPFGAPAAGLDLMRTIQRRLDPTGVFATGRFHGGL